jgi:hypothetical protein
MLRRKRVALAVAVTLAAFLLAETGEARSLVTLRAPHTVRASAAVLSPELTRGLDARAQAAGPRTARDLLSFALDATASQLHFGLHHATTLRFGATPREGNCIEYAELFTAVFNRARRVGGAHVAEEARAFAVHSADARLFGERVPLPGFSDHDWVVVVVGTGDLTKQWLVDPTLYAAGMGWDLSGSVEGRVPFAPR